MIIWFWKYINGYVVIKISGFSPERFINLCANKKLYIWNIKKVSDGFSFAISTKAFFMLRPIARKSGCRIKIIKKVGLPFKFRFFRHRKFFLVGFLLGVFIIVFLSFFIWKIEVHGNYIYTTEQMINYLNDHDIKVGSFKYGIKCSELDSIIISDLEKTMWVSSEIKGTKLAIYIREGIQFEKQEVFNENCDIVANRAGTIVSIITRKGSPLVKQGDEVEIGDVLVTGTLEITELTQLKAVEFTSSDADIYLKTSYDYKDSININYIDKQYIEGGEKKDRTLVLFDYKINLFNPSINDRVYDKMETNKQLVILDNFYLPISIYSVVYKPYYEYEKIYSYDEAKAILQNNLNRTIKELEANNIQIINNNVVYKAEGDYVIAQGEIITIEKTGEKKLFDENVRRQEYNEYFTEDNGDTP